MCTRRIFLQCYQLTLLPNWLLEIDICKGSVHFKRLPDICGYLISYHQIGRVGNTDFIAELKGTFIFFFRDGIYEQATTRSHGSEDILRSWFPFMFKTPKMLPYPNVRKTSYANYVPYDPYKYSNNYMRLIRRKRLLSKPYYNRRRSRY